jgi:flagellar biosynthesis protein FlhG
MISEHSPHILSVGGGKGGIGKSMLSANLAVLLAQAGARVLLVDLDLGGPNLHTLFGQDASSRGLASFLHESRSVLSEHIVNSEIPGLDLLPCCGTNTESGGLHHRAKARLARQLKLCPHDFVLLDLGAGCTGHTLDYFFLADSCVLLSGPEPTAALNGYQFLEQSLWRAWERIFKKYKSIAVPFKQAIMDSEGGFRHFLQHLEGEDPWLLHLLTQIQNDKSFHLVLNQVRSTQQIETGNTLCRLADERLMLPLNFAGVVFYSEEVPASVMQRGPIVHTKPASVPAQSLSSCLDNILLSIAEKNLGDTPLEQKLDRLMQHAYRDYRSNRMKQKRLILQQEAL